MMGRWLTTRQQRLLGVLLIVGSVVGVGGVFAASAVLADDSDASTAAQPTLVGIQGPGAQGMLERYSAAGELEWQRADAASYHDVARLDDGRVVAAYIVDTTDCGPYDAPCGETGFRIIDPETDTIDREWSFRVRTVGDSEVHDVEPLGDGRFLVADMDRERLIIVAQEGTITWQWNASTFYDAPADPTTTDWLHINDVDVIDDGRYLVSVRNANQLLVVERGAGVVEVVNRDDDQDDGSCRRDGKQLVDADGDGDVRCGDPTVFNHQHNPQWLGDDAIVLADSENNRIVELHKQNGSWDVAWTLYSAGGEAFRWPRDADRLPNGQTVITDSRNNRVVAVNESGGVLWQQRTAALPYEADVVGVGEPATGPTYAESAAPAANRQEMLPVFGKVLIGLQHIFAIPYWVTSWHVLAAVIGVNCFSAGGGLLFASRTADATRSGAADRGRSQTESD